MSPAASASAGRTTPTSMFGSVGSGSLKGISRSFVARVQVVQAVQLLRSVQTVSEVSVVRTSDSFPPLRRGGGLRRELNDLNVLNCLNVFISLLHLRQISRQITLQHLVLVVRRVAGRRRFPNALATHAAVFRLGDAHEGFFGHGVDRVIVGLAAE